MAPKRSLANVEILIADSDQTMCQVLTQNLNAMGMTRIQQVSNGREALEAISCYNIDLLITEWVMPHMDGIQLLNHLRCHPTSPNRLLPVLMWTGKGEQSDVELARDHGITEFLIKPYTAKNLFTKIEQMVDHPRSFIACKKYAGPDRRRKLMMHGKAAVASIQLAPEDDRRITKPVECLPNKLTPGLPLNPEMVAAIYALKEAMGIQGALSSVITPQMVEQAQQAIHDLKDASLDWLREGIMELEDCLERARSSATNEERESMKSWTLTLKSRAGTFGHDTVSKIARLLYLFLTNKYRNRLLHNTIVEKHIEALKVALMMGNINPHLTHDVLVGLENVAEHVN